MKTKRYWALVGHWHGAPCAILHGNYVPPFAAWFVISKDEFTKLRKEGFYTRHQVRRPTDKLCLADRELQRQEPAEYEWE